MTKDKKEKMPREQYKTRLIGQNIGNFKVLDFAGYNKNRQIMYRCECQCESKSIVNVSYSDLISGKKDNCGCLTRLKQSRARKKTNRYDLESFDYGVGWTYNTGDTFLFDKEDFERIYPYCWNYHVSKRGLGYVEARTPEGKIIKLHRVIMNENDPKIKIDHIGHDTLDNRKSKLRKTTNQQNCRNHVIHSNNTSGETGVSWENDTQTWRARIFIDGKGIHLGRFEKFEDAVTARKEAEDIYFGQHSYDNSMRAGGIVE